MYICIYIRVYNIYIYVGMDMFTTILYRFYIPHLRTSPAPAEFDHLQVLRPETCVSIDFPSKTEGTNK